MLARMVKILLDTASILHYTFGANSALTVMTPQRAIRCTGLSRPFSFCANAVLKVYDFLLFNFATEPQLDPFRITIDRPNKPPVMELNRHITAI